MGRFLVLIPLVFSIASAILVALALFAGHEKSFMEDYAIARLNTSMIGQNMIDLDGSDDSDSSKDDSKDDDDDDDGFFDDLGDDIKDTWDDVKQDVEDELNDITSDIADKLADTLGISEWYSLHVMTSCEGQYKPNATASTGLNSTQCHNTAPSDAFNLTELLDHELSVGPFELSLNDIDWPSEIQDAIDMLNDVMLALFVLYVLGFAFSGLGVLTSIAAFFLAGRRSVMLANTVISTLAAVCITVGSIVVTVAVTKGISEINDVGEDVGVEAKRGDKFLGISWAASGLMIFATLVWVVLFCGAWRDRKRERRSHTKATI